MFASVLVCSTVVGAGESLATLVAFEVLVIRSETPIVTVERFWTTGAVGATSADEIPSVVFT